jgi:hypothetical protein
MRFGDRGMRVYATIYIDSVDGETVESYQFTEDEIMGCWSAIEYYYDKYKDDATVSMISERDYLWLTKP